MSQAFRLATGGLIDRSRTISVSFDGARYEAHPGDTLASALLANGVRLVGRSFKYHRPRGIFAAGAEESNALVRVRQGQRAEPNVPATMVEVYDGLSTDSQNRWPSLRFDLRAVHSACAPLIPAGFYYKTFMWPAGAWKFYERRIRQAAGVGTAPSEPDADAYEKRYAHCDVLVIGGGPSGIAAALAAAQTGARVMLVDETAGWGGQLKREREYIDDAPALDWVGRTIAELKSTADATLLTRTTAFGFYDHNLVALTERLNDHLPAPPANAARQRLWLVRAAQVVFATGAIERPLIFANNDRPGIMLAGATRAYANQFGVAAGRNAVVFANQDDGYRTALDLADARIVVAAVIDSRPASNSVLAAQVRARSIEILSGHAIVEAKGVPVNRVVVRALNGATGSSTQRTIECDLVAVSGGWNPCIHLHSQSGGQIVFDSALSTYVPGEARQATRAVGAAKGRMTLAACIKDGLTAGTSAARDAGFDTGASPPLPRIETVPEEPIQPLCPTNGPRRQRGKQFVDIQNDVTVKDLELAVQEGYGSVEHLKRYTTLGMGTDQGKTSNMNGIAILALRRGVPIASVGTTTFRPPYTPVSFGSLAGREVDAEFSPIRRSALHPWHVAQGAVFVDAGQWLRPRCYPQAGETVSAAIRRESARVRAKVGLVDVTTLGKIDVQGPDAAEFLDRVYVNSWKALAIGRARYGLMLREDGVAFDDGTTSRLSEHRFFMTTTTANAARVLTHLEYYLQVVWPDLRVQVTSVTEEWASMALAGPLSRDVLAKVVDIDVSATGLPIMGLRDCRIAGVPGRVFRISFSGELAYELAVPADWGLHAWEAVMAAGRPEGIIPYGTEAMATLRIEKGHPAGAELNGQTNPYDLGLGNLVSTKKDFIGRRLLERPAMRDPARPRLVGLVPCDRSSRLLNGAHVVANGDHGSSLGHITSTAFSAELGHPVALALVSDGARRKGQRLVATSPLHGQTTECEVTDTVFIDPQGTRLRA